MDEEIQIESSKTYRILNGRVNGWIDELDAMKQAVEKTLQTERFRFEIYSDNYGIEIENLIGEQYDLVVAEAERIIKEALLNDERIVSIDEVIVSKTASESVLISFIVSTVFGSFSAEQEVSA
ncbi:DUF2634 domain-containing protein [Enterococcus italicus]|uniref:DUF2634 domain-containing protein n=1 Tax=Enterococcus italicus TaxID=246144 RepID=UPI00207318BF|nr:DUF2634 domain-containing protein [Enterococcus italicus]